MTEQTAIEWADATFNPWWGCEKVSPGCAHCYAEGVSNHRAGKGLWGDGHGFRFFGDKHWAEPLKWARLLPAKLGRRPRVFCASMADVFEERPELDEPRDRLVELIASTPELDWLILTKRPEFARDYLAAVDPGAPLHADDPLPNVWLGVSIENARYTWRADVLRQIPAAVRFISAEPLLGSLYDRRRDDEEAAVPAGSRRAPLAAGLARARVARVDAAPATGDLPQHEERPVALRSRAPLDLTGIDWVIIGGESGPKSRPFHLEHARELIRACRELEINSHSSPAVFVKQLGARPVVDYDVDGHPCSASLFGIRDRKGGDWDEWEKAPDLRIREFPTSAAVPA